MSAITLPEGYGYVLAAATSTCFVHILHYVGTVFARRAAGVNYPACYASDEEAKKNPAAFKFNCAQRSHANFTENVSPFLVVLGVAGLSYPTAAATLGATWSVGRVAYYFGYTSDSGPKGRTFGSAMSGLSTLILLGMASWSSFKYIAAQ